MRIKRFNEKNLTITDLEKTAPDGTTRGDVLVSKLKKQIQNPDDKSNFLTFKPNDKSKIEAPVSNAEELIDNITDGPEQTFDTEKSKEFFLKGRNYIKRFQVFSDKFKLNDLEKTKEFGSSAGSSLGSEQTKIVESIQCLYCALRQELGRNLVDIDSELLFEKSGEINENILNYVRIPISINSEIIEKYNESWLETFLSTANSLYEVRKLYTDKPEIFDKKEDSILNPSRKYIFYQINFKSGIINSVNKNYKKFSEAQRIPIEKWNPSDMWIVDSQSEDIIMGRLDRVDTIQRLNQCVDNLFRNKLLVGVSLKKVKKLSSAKLLINKVTPKPFYKFLKARTSVKPLSSLGVTLVLQQYSTLKEENRNISVNLRTFGGKERITDISGEITGTSARYGKISLNKINQIFSKYSTELDINIPLIENHTLLSNKTSEELLEEIELMNEYIGGKGDKTRETKVEANVSNRVRLISKYQALKVAKNFYEFPAIKDEICQDIMYYALAIRNDLFESPMYVRIV